MGDSITLVCDYDGTLATSGRVSASTVRALTRFRDAGHHLVMNTGREIEDLLSLFPETILFSCVVGENGALLYDTTTREITLLADPVPPPVIEELRIAGVGPLYVGRVLVAATVEYAAAVRATLASSDHPAEMIMNKDAIMILPRGVDKGTGLRPVWSRYGFEQRMSVGVGDGENDVALLEACAVGVALANSVDELFAVAAYRTSAGRGEGVEELIDNLLEGRWTIADAARSDAKRAEAGEPLFR